MTEFDWVLLQLVVAGCTGLCMWGVVWVAASMWNKRVYLRRMPKTAKSEDRLRSWDRL